MIAISKNKKTLSNITQDKALYFCIENQFFRDYLAENCDEKNITYTNLDLIDLPGTISSNPNAIILLQSETQEQKIIDLSAKLKLLFGADVKSILLSTDYRIATEVEFKFDDFIWKT